MTLIKLDLRTDLAKVSRETCAEPGIACTYTAPCAVGAMMTPEQRQQLKAKNYDHTRVKLLAIGAYGAEQLIAVPDDQLADFGRLQQAFDGTIRDDFDTVLAELKEKYSV